MKTIHPTALFRLSVLGPLASRERLSHGELKRIIKELAAQRYEIPHSRHHYLSPKTIESWYYAWKKGGIDALAPQTRRDKGHSKLPATIQEIIIQAKREQPTRSLNEIQRILENSGVVAKGEVSRSTLHRLLQQHGLSRPAGHASEPVERRSFEARFAGDLWYGDVMHGPSVCVDGRMRKVYLVSLMDDASRLITHSAFCLGETALDVEGVLKQAVLRHGLPKKLVIDNGAAYRAKSLQGICARLEVRLVYCRPYAPEGKGKIERWHRTLRQQFLAELNLAEIRDLPDLNARLWAWLEQVYHTRIHTALNTLTPRQRWHQDLVRVRPLGPFALRLDEVFYHRIQRKVRRDGTIAWQGRYFEVPHTLNGKHIVLVVDPHQNVICGIEDAQGQHIGDATPLDKLANSTRRRQQKNTSPTNEIPQDKRRFNAIDQAVKKQTSALVIRDHTLEAN